MKQKCSIRTPLGEMIAAVELDSLCGLWFVGQKYVPEDIRNWKQNEDHPLLATLRRQLASYFSGQLRAFDVPLALMGTPFQMAVWALLRTVPAGNLITYGALAKQMAIWQIPSARAVGGAVGHNPISIIIPCHRVVGADGSLTGYAGGLDRMAALLALEKDY